MNKIGSLIGVGAVYQNDTPLGKGNYELDIYQEFIDSSSLQGGARTPGLKRIEGHVQGTFPIGRILKLVTAQGQTLNFFIADSDGNIRASGPFLNPDGTPVDLRP